MTREPDEIPWEDACRIVDETAAEMRGRVKESREAEAKVTQRLTEADMDGEAKMMTREEQDTIRKIWKGGVTHGTAVALLDHADAADAEIARLNEKCFNDTMAAKKVGYDEAKAESAAEIARLEKRLAEALARAEKEAEVAAAMRRHAQKCEEVAKDAEAREAEALAEQDALWEAMLAAKMNCGRCQEGRPHAGVEALIKHALANLPARSREYQAAWRVAKKALDIIDGFPDGAAEILGLLPERKKLLASEDAKIVRGSD